MFNINEYVKHDKTGKVGKVTGYGHELIDNVYTATVKVLISEPANSLKQLDVIEDVISAWNSSSI